MLEKKTISKYLGCTFDSEPILSLTYFVHTNFDEKSLSLNF